MRRLCLVTTIALVLLGLSLVSPAAASLSGETAPPGPPGPNAGARSSQVTAPITGTRAPAIVSTASLACDQQFDAVTSPNGTGHNVLLSTAAVSANDVWAVGLQTTTSNIDRTLAEHWNGTTWKIVPTINPGPGHNDLNGVSAVSANDVWAVGAYETNHTTEASATLAEHWNGTTWTKVATPNPSTYSYLYAVTAVSATNVWAVGTYYNFSVGIDGAYQTLIEHYDGTSWSWFPSPSSNAAPLDAWNTLLGVSAWSATDIWAVGNVEPDFGPSVSLAEHYDGFSWTVISTPNDGVGADNAIIGVSALEAGHAVGVGFGNLVSGSTPRRGEAWDLLVGAPSTIQPEIGPGSGDNALLGVAMSGAGLWAVGYWRGTSTGPRQTLVIPANWDSVAHTLVWGPLGTSASPGTLNNVLYGVAAISPDVFWATGYLQTGTYDQSLTEFYCALHFSVSAPSAAVAGVPFALTVTAQNANNSTATGYRGTVHFTSSDALAVLPADYTFTSGDAGVHAFSGVILKNPYNQPSSITVSDVVAPMITGSTSITVACSGVCQSSAGTPGARGVQPGGAGSAGARDVDQSPSGSPGPRTPIRASVTGVSSAAIAHPARSTASIKSVIGVRTTSETHVEVVSQTTRINDGLATARVDERVIGSSRSIASPRAPEWVWSVGLVVLGLFGLLAPRRRRNEEESNVRDKP